MATGELRLEVPEREFTDLTRWRWVLTDGGRYVADHEVRLDPGCSQYEAFTDLPRYLSWHAAPDTRAEDEARITAEIGAWIGESVLGPVAGALANLARLRPVTVRVVVPERARALLYRPLQLGYVNGKPLAVQDVNLVMEVGSPADSASHSGGNGVPDGGRLRVLGLFSLPEGGQALNLRRERHSLVQLIRSIAASGDNGKAADVRVLQYGVTREALRDALEDGEGWDVIHISGHGSPGELVFEDEHGRPDHVSAGELADLLYLARERVKLVTVSACWSAAMSAADQRRLLGLPVPSPRAKGPEGGSPGDDAAGEAPSDGGIAAGDLATTLTKNLGCAVLAMRYPVGDDFAIELSGKLYELLADKGQPLPRAVGLTLRELSRDKRWPALSLVTPALFGGRAAGLKLAAPELDAPQPFRAFSLKMAGFPPQPDRFVGRVGVMTRASAALAAKSGVPGVLLHGMPGGGKTACALELAYTHEHAFPCLIWYKAPDEGLAINDALARFALTLENGIPGFQMAHLLTDPAKLTAFLPRLTELVELKRILIVLDNIESLLTEDGYWRDRHWGQVVNALSAHKGLGRLIITTRRLPKTAESGGLQTVSM